MRIVTWNMHGGGEAKWATIAARSPDVAVLQEVHREPPRRLDLSFENWEWTGGDTGIGIGSTDDNFEPVRLENSGRFSVAAVSHGLPIVGVWSCPTKTSLATYRTEVTNTIGACAALLRERHGVLLGDFNVIPGANGNVTTDFARVRDELDELGYVSAYHEFFGEAFGEESRATHYHTYREAKPFHIDFCFVAREILGCVRSIEVGTFAEVSETRLSDHVPVTIDLDL